MRQHIYATISLSVFRDHIKSRKSMRRSQKNTEWKFVEKKREDSTHSMTKQVKGNKSYRCVSVCVSDVGKEATTKHRMKYGVNLDQWWKRKDK